MLIIARTTWVQTVVMNGNNNTSHIIVSWYEREDRKVSSVVWKPRVTVQMRRGEAGRSRRWHQKPETPLADSRETNGRNVQKMWGRRPQPLLIAIIYCHNASVETGVRQRHITQIAPQATYSSYSCAFVLQTEWPYSRWAAVQAPRAYGLLPATEHPHTAQVCHLTVLIPVIHVITRVATHSPTPKGGRLSWPNWLTHSRQFTHKVANHRSGAGQGKQPGQRPTS